ncbi:MAG: twin-arginine translocation signal domain-containing protein [Prolixibacteraceae bacterium]|jgi:predicted amidohydrolase|nr:twin-arginine translocation signal domain-containing protein [Prolixibacteraceae bacterium]
MKSDNFSRRNFLKTSAITSGLAAVSPLGLADTLPVQDAVARKLPREVWVTSVSMSGLRAETPGIMVDEIVRVLNDHVPHYQPDIICLPETFATSHLPKSTPWAQKLGICEKVLQQFSNLAKQSGCYLICPVYTSEGGKIYNSAVIFDRGGNKIGAYRKIYLTDYEIESGLTPGPLTPPVFQTDFGKIGIQICFDIEWKAGWEKLREQGAEIVFWPSAFTGGQLVNTKAWENKYVVVSSPWYNPSKICDISGTVISDTGMWDKNLVCAPVNLEKVLIHRYPFNRHFDKIREKYGRKVRITTFFEEDWSVIESLSPEVFVADILKEFNIPTHEQYIRGSEAVQIKARKG